MKDKEVRNEGTFRVKLQHGTNRRVCLSVTSTDGKEVRRFACIDKKTQLSGLEIDAEVITVICTLVMCDAYDKETGLKIE